MGSRLVGALTLALLRALAWALATAPPRAREALGGALGALLRSSGLRRRVVEENLIRAFPDRGPGSDALREQVRREAYGHLGRLVLEILMLLGPLRRVVERQVDVRGYERVEEALRGGKGAILLSSHVGNWEWMAAKGGALGIDLMIVTKRLKPEWLHAAIETGRARCGVRAAYEPRTLADVTRHLEKGGLVGFVLDQYAGAPIGVRVPYFGVPVGTATTLASIVRRTGAPVLPVVIFREPSGRHTIEVERPLEWLADGENVQEEIASNTARYVARVESHVKAHPGQWLWIHRRFKGDLSPLRLREWKESRARRS